MHLDTLLLGILVSGLTLAPQGPQIVDDPCVVPDKATLAASELGDFDFCGTPRLTIVDDLSGFGAALPAPGVAVTVFVSALPGSDAIPTFSIFRSQSGEVATMSESASRTVIKGDSSVLADFQELSGPVDFAAATSTKCTNQTYKLVGGQKWADPYAWRFKTPSFGGQARVAAALTAMTNGLSDCGAPVSNSASHSYLGTTNLSANFNGTTCGVSDGTNVIDAGVISASAIAATCLWRTAFEIICADVRLKSSAPWYTSASTSGCSGKYDLQGVMTHEAGHVFGLDEVDVTTEQVMRRATALCLTSQRLLGSGDLKGMKGLYP